MFTEQFRCKVVLEATEEERARVAALNEGREGKTQFETFPDIKWGKPRHTYKEALDDAAFLATKYKGRFRFAEVDKRFVLAEAPNSEPSAPLDL